MAQKRVNEQEGSELTGREKKKLKVTAARTINVQTPASQVASGSGGSLNVVNSMALRYNE